MEQCSANEMSAACSVQRPILVDNWGELALCRISKLQQLQEQCDVIFRFPTEDVQAHSLLFHACSPGFLEVVGPSTHELKVLAMPGHVSADSLKSVLRFVYQGRLSVPYDAAGVLAVARLLRLHVLERLVQAGVQRSRAGEHGVGGGRGSAIGRLGILGPLLPRAEALQQDVESDVSGDERPLLVPAVSPAESEDPRSPPHPASRKRKLTTACIPQPASLESASPRSVSSSAVGREGDGAASSALVESDGRLIVSVNYEDRHDHSVVVRALAESRPSLLTPGSRLTVLVKCDRPLPFSVGPADSDDVPPPSVIPVLLNRSSTAPEVVFVAVTAACVDGVNASHLSKLLNLEVFAAQPGERVEREETTSTENPVPRERNSYERRGTYRDGEDGHDANDKSAGDAKTCGSRITSPDCMDTCEVKAISEEPQEVRVISPEEACEVRVTSPEEPSEVRVTSEEPCEVRVTSPEEPCEVRVTSSEDSCEVKVTSPEDSCEVRVTSPEDSCEVRLTPPEEPCEVRVTSPEEPREVRVTSEESCEVRVTPPEEPCEIGVNSDNKEARAHGVTTDDKATYKEVQCAAEADGNEAPRDAEEGNDGRSPTSDSETGTDVSVGDKVTDSSVLQADSLDEILPRENHVAPEQLGSRIGVDSSCSLLQTRNSGVDSSRGLVQTRSSGVDSSCSFLQTRSPGADLSCCLLQTMSSEVDSSCGLQGTKSSGVDSSCVPQQTTSCSSVTSQSSAAPATVSPSPSFLLKTYRIKNRGRLEGKGENSSVLS